MDHEIEEDPSSRLGSRKALRSRVEVMIGLRNGQNNLRASVTDISVTGLQLQTLSPLKVGGTYWVKLPTIEARHVTVIWTDGFIGGCEFDEPLPQFVLEHIMKSMTISEPAIIDRRGVPRD